MPLKTKPKQFTYRTHLQWVDRGQKRGVVNTEQAEQLEVAPPVEFKGPGGVWTPETLFVAALESCLMTTFAVFAERMELDVVSYTSESEGVVEAVDAHFAFTRFTVKPRIRVRGEPDETRVRAAVEQAKRNCFVSQSIRADVTLTPQIEIL